ncbi:DNA topoisomerase IB [Pseudoluteimonas lycopersici]|uniref:DNA topoisomerase IB n=1 Tax=Pseudoluteimonas lycopersici TaxID=1324796 RepID=UPI001FEA4E79|nr:DNA topoisomerase IB [Lysobacter lycopersici]
MTRLQGLHYVSDAMPGIRRKGSKRFRYLSPKGRTIRAPRTLERIRALAIPPAWSDVWICADPNGHLQATGRDARGRKQYRYHPRWNRLRGRDKHARIVAFGTALPKLRSAVRKALAIPGFPKDKVVAMVAAVMGTTLIRIGNEQYAESNHSYGLTTLRNRHVQAMRRGGLRFQFRGKSGKLQEVMLTDARLTKLIKRCQQLPGQMLFQYVDADGHTQPIDSSDVNRWLQETMGEDFSAKDFRTWGATALAFRALASNDPPVGEDGKPTPDTVLAAMENSVVEQVAGVLGNSKTICRNSYIDPSLYAAWRSGQLSRYAKNVRGERQWETAMLRFLRSQHPMKKLSH